MLPARPPNLSGLYCGCLRYNPDVQARRELTLDGSLKALLRPPGGVFGTSLDVLAEFGIRFSQVPFDLRMGLDVVEGHSL